MAKSVTKKARKSSSSQPEASQAASDQSAQASPVSTQDLKASILNHLQTTLARHQQNATADEWWTATCLAVRDHVIARFMKTQAVHHDKKVKRAYYLSLEYLMGRLLPNNLHNCGLAEPVKAALMELGQDFSKVIDEEADMGLGNGGLGRLAACFLDSLATLDLPAIGIWHSLRIWLVSAEVHSRPSGRISRRLADQGLPLGNYAP